MITTNNTRSTSAVHTLLRKYFGYEKFRNPQEEIIQTVLSKKDVLVLMPTGGGKSICFQLPALLIDGITLVISPLISLMKDQVDALKANGIEAEFMNSSLSYQHEAEIMERASAGKIKLLYLSPEKTLSLLNRELNGLNIQLIAIDEAHCVSQWGHDFRPEYKELHLLREHFPDVPMMALTATADKLTRQDILTHLGLKDAEQFVSSFDRPNISLSVKFGFAKKEKIKDMQRLIRSKPNECGIIYCTARKSTEAVAIELNKLGINAKHYHAGMSAEERTKVQEDFLNDDVRVVCATVAFGMGIDKSNVRFVLHYNLPKSMESFYQEIGRGGRDGMPCDTILYYGLGDLMMLRDFAQGSGQPEINIEKLNRIQEYAEAKICRRKILLNYFGENLRENCGNCDVCKDPPKQMDGTVIAQKALSALSRIHSSGEKAGTHMLIDVLRGLKHQEILNRNFDKLKTYGAGAEYSFKEWSAFIIQMIQLGMLEIAYNEKNTLRITQYGQLILKGTFKVDLVVQTSENNFAPKKTISRTSEVSDLFESLRLLRKEVALEKNVPPYVIFHDSTLHEMVKQHPSTKEEMLQISGVSNAKMEQYGNLFLEKILSSNESSNDISTLSIDEVISDENLFAYMKEMKEMGFPIRHSVVGKLLIGSLRSSIAVKGEKLSFYGKLRNKASYNFISKKLKIFYAPYSDKEKEVIKISKQASDTERMQIANDFFNKEPFSFFNEEMLSDLKKNIASIPIVKTNESFTSPQAIEMRKKHHRHMEPWSEKEYSFLENAIAKTNDVQLLSHHFGRSINSITATTTNILLKQKKA